MAEEFLIINLGEEDDYADVEIFEDEIEELLRDDPTPPERVIRYESDEEPTPGPSVATVPEIVPHPRHMGVTPEMTEMEKLDEKERMRKRRKEKSQALLDSLGDRIKKRSLTSDSKYAHLAPFMTDSEDSGSGDFEEDVPAWRRKKFKQAKVDGNWDNLAHGEITAREYSEWVMPYYEPVPMPVLSLSQAIKKLSKEGPYFVKRIPDQDFTEFRAGTPVSSSHRDVKRFVEEVERWRFCSFDTEGNAELSYIPATRGHGRVFVCYSSPVSGSVLCFHDAKDTPASIRGILEDYRFAKIQSGIHLDVNLLAKEGIRVRGIIDSGTLMVLVDPQNKSFGAATQIATIWGKEHHQKWDKKFMAEYRTQKLSMPNQRHSIQDVLTPYAVALKAAVLEAGQRMYVDEDDVFPLINEALELCYSKCPADVRHPTDGLKKDQAFRNWHPQMADTKFGLNCRIRCQTIRRARGDLVETFENREGHRPIPMEDRIASAVKIWPGPEMPCSNDYKWANLFIRQNYRCQNCAAKTHSYDDCPEEKTKCVYPHGPGSQKHPPHSTLMCPSLHSACMQCRVRGHLRDDHDAGMQQSPMQLRQRFLEFAHLGFLTCVPFLYTVRRLEHYVWSATLGFARLMRNAPDLWIYAGLYATVPEELRQRVKPQLDQARRNLESTPATYESFRQEKV